MKISANISAEYDPALHHAQSDSDSHSPAATTNTSGIQPKSPSPPHSTAPTTGTTTTPTSLSNTSCSPDNEGKFTNRHGDRMLSLQESPHEEPSAFFSLASQQPYAGSLSAHETDAGSQPRYNPATFPAAIKLLVSNNVAGSIIGRAGQTISEMQMHSHTRIKLSQTGDYYPGTQDRVCLVQGELEPVKLALRLLLERIYMLQEHQHSQHMTWQVQKHKGAATPAFDFVVRILVPSSSCGMIIGKSGSNIKYLEENTGVTSVRLSPKEGGEFSYQTSALAAATTERAVTITGPTLDSCLQCLYLILDGMTTHPDISRYSNMTTSYSRILADAIPQYNPSQATLRPVLVPGPPPSPRHSNPEHHLWDGVSAGLPYPILGPRMLGRRIVSSPDLPGLFMSHQMTESHTPERLGSYPPPLGAQHPFSTMQEPRTPTGSHPLYLMPNVDGIPELPMSHMLHSSSAPDLLAMQLSPHASPPGAGHETGSFVPQTPTMTAPGCYQVQILVPDSMIGSVLGRAGRTLTELQVMTGTRIRITQRGEYMPGTRSRVVTIRGTTAQSVWQVQYMMSQRMILPPTAVSMGMGPYGAGPSIPMPFPEESVEMMSHEGTLTLTQTEGHSHSHAPWRSKD
jgi:RNA-binding protein Nova